MCCHIENMEAATPNGDEAENKDGRDDVTAGARHDEPSFKDVRIIKKKNKVYTMFYKLWGSRKPRAKVSCDGDIANTSENVIQQGVLRNDNLKFSNTSGTSAQDLQTVKLRNEKKFVSFSEFVVSDGEPVKKVGNKCKHSGQQTSNSGNSKTEATDDVERPCERHRSTIIGKKQMVKFSPRLNVPEERCATMTKHDGHESIAYTRTNTNSRFIKRGLRTSCVSEWGAPYDFGNRQKSQDKLMLPKSDGISANETGMSITKETQIRYASRSVSADSIWFSDVRGPNRTYKPTSYRHIPSPIETRLGEGSSTAIPSKPLSHKSLQAAFQSPLHIAIHRPSDVTFDRRAMTKRDRSPPPPAERSPSPVSRWPFWKKKKESTIHLRRANAVEEITQSRQHIQYEVPDGGYGWVCVFCVFVIYTMIQGVYRAAGIVIEEVKKEFPDTSMSVITLMPALSIALSVAFAIVAGGLARKYTTRPVAMISGFIMSLSLMSIYFATSVGYMYICYIFAGIFAAGTYMPGIMIVALYFRRRRGLATGLALTGSAVGGIFHPPILRMLVDLYNFRGAMLIMGALSFHVVPCAMLLHNPWDRVVLSYRKKRKSEIYVEGDELPFLIPVTHSYPSDTSDEDEEPLSVVTMQNTLPNSSTTSEITAAKSPPNIQKRQVHIARHDLYGNVLKFMTSRHPSKVHLSWDSKSRVYRAYKTPKLEARYSIFEPKRNPCTEWLYRTLYIDLAYFANPVFLIVLLASIFTTGSYPYVVLFLPGHGQQGGGYSEKDSAVLVTICALGDLLGRSFFGWFFDKHYISLQYGLLIFTLVIGCSLCILVLSTNYVHMSMCVFVYGMAGGPTVLLIPILLSDHHGAASLGSSYGIVRLGQAIISIITPPIAGLLQERTHSYIFSFLVFAFSAFAGAFVMVFMSTAKKRYRRTAEQKLTSRIRYSDVKPSAVVVQSTRTGSPLTTRPTSQSLRRGSGIHGVLDSRSDTVLDLDT